MLVIVLMIFVLFMIMLVKYCEWKDILNYELDMYGSKKLEIFWILILVVIVIVLVILIVKIIYVGEEVLKVILYKDLIVIYVISVDWKWIFSYLDELIEIVNYVNILIDCFVLFKLIFVDMMISFWVL